MQSVALYCAAIVVASIYLNGLLCQEIGLNTMLCDRRNMLWELYPLKDVLNDIDERHIRTRLMEKLPKFCCNPNFKGALLEYKNSTIKCQSEKMGMWPTDLPDGKFFQYCSGMCYLNYLEDLMDVKSRKSMRDKGIDLTGCRVSQFRNDPKPNGASSYNCHLVDGPSSEITDQYRCEVVQSEERLVPGNFDLGFDTVLEINPQCVVPNKVDHYVVKLCSTTSPGCEKEFSVTDNVFLACHTEAPALVASTVVVQSWSEKHSIKVDTVTIESPPEPEDPDGEGRRKRQLEKVECMDSFQEILNKEIKLQWFPTEIELNMLSLGVRACGEEFTQIQDPLKLQFHCFDPRGNPQDQWSSAARPKTWSEDEIEATSCLHHGNSFETMPNTGLSDCTSYATDNVLFDWMCKTNCLAYLHNAYNEPDLTHSEATCRAVVIEKAGSVICNNCLFYDWAPDEQIYRIRTQGCTRKTNEDHTLHLIKSSCYEGSKNPAVGSPDLPWIPVGNCAKPTLAFEEIEVDKEVGICPSSQGWPLDYISGDSLPYTSRFNWAYLLVLPDLLSTLGTTNYNMKIIDEFGTLNINLLRFYCQEECLRYTRDYFTTKGSEGICRSVAVMKVEVDEVAIENMKEIEIDYSMFDDGIYECFFKTWNRDEEKCSQPVAIDKTNAITKKILHYREYKLLPSCYEPLQAKTIDDETDEFNINHLGCFKQIVERLKASILDMKSFTEYRKPNVYDMSKHRPSYCAQRCFSKFGLQISGVGPKKCICLNKQRLMHAHFYRPDIMTDSELCHQTQCPGDSLSDCGGMSTPGSAETWQYVMMYEKGLEHLGCFNFVNSSVWHVKQNFIHNNTPEYCANQCLRMSEKLKLAGVMNGKYCLCGQNHDAYSGIPKLGLDCSLPCPGDQKKKSCGSLRNINIFLSLDTIDSRSIVNGELDVNYIMCLKDTRSFQTSNEEFEITSAGQCAHMCYYRITDHRYSVSGTQISTTRIRCMCATVDEMNSWTGTVMDDSHCNKTQCPTDHNLCGGPNAMAMYQKPLPYIGCYKNDPLNLLLREESKEFKFVHCEKKNSPEMCANWCNDVDDNLNRYAGVQNGMCYCGNNDSFNDMKSLPTDQCQSECPGDHTLRCGSQENIAIFHSETTLLLGELSYSIPHVECARAAEESSNEETHLESKIAQCIQYLDSIGQNEMSTIYAKNCRDLLGILSADRYGVEWCEEKLKLHEKTKPHLMCVKQCKTIVAGSSGASERYSIAWCHQKLKVYNETKPHLVCVKKCKAVLENQPKDKKYSVKYCNEKIANYGENKPTLQCVKKCKELFNMGEPKTTKYGMEYCREKLDTYGLKKPNLKCVAKCNVLFDSLHGPDTTKKPWKYGKEYCRKKFKAYKKDKGTELSCITKCIELFGEYSF